MLNKQDNITMARYDSQQNLINKYSMKFKKHLGQNFLVDDYYSDQLLESANLNSDDIVIEIGTGMGAITLPLSERVKHVFTFEKDTEVYNQFLEGFGDVPNVTQLHTDLLVLEGSLDRIVHTTCLKSNHNVTPDILNYAYKVVSSLPYNVSKRFVNYFLSQSIKPTTITYLLQKEVAKKYCAKVPHATFLSNMISQYGKCSYKGTVPKEAFYPIPKVDGGIIHIEIDEEKTRNVDEKLIKFIKAGFTNPRKNISNVLSSNLHVEKSLLNKTLLELNLDPNFRAENLTTEQWKTLYTNLNLKQKS